MTKQNESLMNALIKALDDIASIGFLNGDNLGNADIFYSAENHRKCNEIACEALCLLEEQSD